LGEHVLHVGSLKHFLSVRIWKGSQVLACL
jgi:hypothetical protein